MEIEKLSRDVLVSALVGLQKTGLVKDEDILEAIKIEPSNEMKRISDKIHGLFCTANHDAGHCDYYNEDTMTNCWTCVAHKEWLDNALAWMEALDVKGETELDHAIGEAMRLMGSIKKMEKASQKILTHLLKIESYV